MKVVNRGFILVRQLQPFWDWANQYNEEIQFNEEDGVEPNCYLIEDDFMEIEPVIEQNFKKIFKNELAMACEDESNWPEKLTLELFLTFFDIELGTSVFDLQKSDLKVDFVN
jgi:hypothetical protein